MASFAQLGLIRTLWDEWTGGTGTAEGLTTRMEKTFHGQPAVPDQGTGSMRDHRLEGDKGPHGLTGPGRNEP